MEPTLSLEQNQESTSTLTITISLGNKTLTTASVLKHDTSNLTEKVQAYVNNKMKDFLTNYPGDSNKAAKVVINLTTKFLNDIISKVELEHDITKEGVDLNDENKTLSRHCDQLLQMHMERFLLESHAMLHSS
ncbi:hypothetical protein K0U07_01560 [bacterium]|nr:hypothetical protein [bacterium]